MVGQMKWLWVGVGIFFYLFTIFIKYNSFLLYGVALYGRRAVIATSAR